MCLWLSLRGTGPITCTGKPGRGLYPALNWRVLSGGNPRLMYLQGELLRWAEWKQILGAFTFGGEHGESGPICKHRGVLIWGDKEA